MYLKYPKIARTFFIFEMIINIQDAFVANSDRAQQMHIMYASLFLNYWILSCYDFLASFSAALLYISVYVYAQNLVYVQSQSSGEITLSNIPLALNSIGSIVVSQCIWGKFFRLIQERNLFQSGHV